ncbi:hypothetical protein ABTE19_22575, partial [Acinetobacter baumannii]
MNSCAPELLQCGRADISHGDESDVAFTLALGGGSMARAKTVVIASGARYRRPDIGGLGEFEGA